MASNSYRSAVVVPKNGFTAGYLFPIFERLEEVKRLTLATQTNNHLEIEFFGNLTDKQLSELQEEFVELVEIQGEICEPDAQRHQLDLELGQM